MLGRLKDILSSLRVVVAIIGGALTLYVAYSKGGAEISASSLLAVLVARQHLVAILLISVALLILPLIWRAIRGASDAIYRLAFFVPLNWQRGHALTGLTCLATLITTALATAYLATAALQSTYLWYREWHYLLEERPRQSLVARANAAIETRDFIEATHYLGMILRVFPDDPRNRASERRLEDIGERLILARRFMSVSESFEAEDDIASAFLFREAAIALYPNLVTLGAELITEVQSEIEVRFDDYLNYLDLCARDEYELALSLRHKVPLRLIVGPNLSGAEDVPKIICDSEPFVSMRNMISARMPLEEVILP